MTPNQIRIFAGAIALVVLGGFLLIYLWAVYLTWTAPGKPPDLSAAFVYVGTGIAGLVGAVVAMFFNEKLPDAPDKPPGVPPQSGNAALSIATPSATGIDAAVNAVKSIANLGTKDFLALVATGYCYGYTLIGVLAIATWIVADAKTPEMVKNLALIAFGLFLAIARTFIGMPKPS